MYKMTVSRNVQKYWPWLCKSSQYLSKLGNKEYLQRYSPRYSSKDDVGNAHISEVPVTLTRNTIRFLLWVAHCLK